MEDDDSKIVQLFKNASQSAPDLDIDLVIEDLIEFHMKELLYDIFDSTDFDISDNKFLKDFSVVMLMAKSMMLRADGREHPFQQIVDELIYIEQFDKEVDT